MCFPPAVTFIRHFDFYLSQKDKAADSVLPSHFQNMNYIKLFTPTCGTNKKDDNSQAAVCIGLEQIDS